jgi:hypothetical protein
LFREEPPTYPRRTAPGGRTAQRRVSINCADFLFLLGGSMCGANAALMYRGRYSGVACAGICQLKNGTRTSGGQASLPIPRAFRKPDTRKETPICDISKAPAGRTVKARSVGTLIETDRTVRVSTTGALARGKALGSCQQKPCLPVRHVDERAVRQKAATCRDTLQRPSPLH